MFEDEVQFLRGVFGDQIIRFEHFGSTSVPGMKAKPVIDMMCLVKDIKKIDTYNEQMRLLGYDVAGEWGYRADDYFAKVGKIEPITSMFISMTILKLNDILCSEII